MIDNYDEYNDLLDNNLDDDKIKIPSDLQAIGPNNSGINMVFLTFFGELEILEGEIVK